MNTPRRVAQNQRARCSLAFVIQVYLGTITKTCLSVYALIWLPAGTFTSRACVRHGVGSQHRQRMQTDTFEGLMRRQVWRDCTVLGPAGHSMGKAAKANVKQSHLSSDSVSSLSTWLAQSRLLWIYKGEDVCIIIPHHNKPSHN